MDEILHLPQQEEGGERLTARLRARAETAGAALRTGAERFRRWTDTATAGGRRIISPLHFLAQWSPPCTPPPMWWSSTVWPWAP